MKIFLISPVRKVTKKERKEIERYVARLEKEELRHVHWPERDTNQNDAIGLRICEDNRRAIRWADEVHIWWNGKSSGSLFDFGMALAMQKKIILANPAEVRQLIRKEKTKGVRKSFNKVLVVLHRRNTRQ